MRLAFLRAMILTSSLVIAGFADAASTTRHDFGQKLQGDVVQHEFRLENDTGAPLRISGVQLTPPLSLARMPAVIPPHAHATLAVRLDTSKVQGDYEGRILVKLDGGGERTFAFDGKVVRPIEVVPMPAFFISTSKGAAKSASLEIVNREEAPLALEAPAGAPFPATLETLEAGKRFRLTVTVPPTATPGRLNQRLELRTSSQRQPVLYVGLNSIVRERVYTFPDAVDFGRVHGGRPGGQTLMVYQSGGKGFNVEPRSDIPGLAIAAEPGPQGDRVQLTLTLPADAKPGPVKGTIIVRTNDPEFPELRVPVTGSVE